MNHKQIQWMINLLTYDVTLNVFKLIAVFSVNQRSLVSVQTQQPI